MNAAERRDRVLEYIRRQSEPVSATVIAGEFNVSRQIIVGDVAILRAGGHGIAATPRGYLMTGQEQDPQGVRRQIACLHSLEQMQEELNICVDYGCSVEDVIVEHPIYGQLSGQLQIHSRYEVMQFMEKVRGDQVHSLSELTDGIHLHTLVCPDEAAFEQVTRRLKEAGILFRE